MKYKFFLWLSILSAMVINIATAIQWEYAYIIFGVAVCTLIVGIIGTIVFGGFKQLLNYLEKII